MVRRIEYGGRVHEFPDDASDEEIAATLESMPAAPSQPQHAPTPRPPQLTPQQQSQLAVQATGRLANRNALPFGQIAEPVATMLSDPARRAQLGQALQGAWRDVQQIPSLDVGQLGRETWQSMQGAVRNLPNLPGQIANNLPQIARNATYGPFVDAERAQQQVDLARILGDEEGEQTAAREANIATGGAVTNTVGFGVGSAVRTPLQAGGLALALDAPHALSRGEGSLQERLPAALTEMAGAAGFGATAQYGANRLQDALRAPPRTGEMVARMDRAGVQPSLAAANGGGVSGTATKVIGDNLAAGPMVRARTERQLTQTRDAAQRIAREYGRPRDPQGVGNLVNTAIRRYSTQRGLPNPEPGVDPLRVSTQNWSLASKAEAVYDQALRPVEGNPATLANTRAVLEDLNRRTSRRDVREFVQDPAVSEFESLVRRLSVSTRDDLTPLGAEDIDFMVRDIEAARSSLANAEQSLSTWVRRRGIGDDRGDIRGLDPAGRGASSVLRGNGRSADDLAVAAWEDGFFPGAEPPSIREFQDALAQDLRNPGSVLRGNAGGMNPANDARRVLNHYESLGVDVGLRGDRLRQALTPLIGEEGRAALPPPTLADLRELRRVIREQQRRSPALGQTVDNAALQRLEAALTDDIYRAAGDAAPNLQAADRWYRRSRQRVDDALTDFTDARSPGEAIQTILRLAQPRGDARALATLRNAMRPDEWRQVAASIIEEMGRPTASAADISARIGFSVNRFATAYRNMSPQARRILFGSRASGLRGQQAARLNDLADELDNLARVAQNLKAVEARANFSGTFSHAQTAGLFALSASNLPAALATITGLGLIGEVLTNARAVRWLTSAPRNAGNAQGMRRWLSDLSRLAAQDPALVPVYNEIAQSQARQSGVSAAQSERPLEPLQ